MTLLIQDIPLSHLQRGRYQPRKQFTQEELQELATSIEANGLIQPIVVRPAAQDHYEIVAGERRWRAAQLANLKDIPCLIKHYNDEQTAAIALIENVNRSNLNPIEEAHGYQRLVDEFAYSHEEIAAITGKSRAKISNMLRLLRLDERIQAWLVEGQLSEGHGKILAGLPSSQQYALAQQCVQGNWNVRRLERASKSKGKRQPAELRSDADVQSLENALSDYLTCPVSLDYRAGQCRIKIECYNLDVLQGVLAKIGFQKCE